MSGTKAHTMLLGPLVVLTAATFASACLPDNPPLESGATDTEGDPTPTDEWPTSGLLGCPGGECTFLFVAQTLDDRVEIFTPRMPEPYRGTVHTDLTPNLDGDTRDGRLDEPYGMGIGGGYLHLLVGHYPTRAAGSVVAFPLQWLSAFERREAIATGEYFENGMFGNGVVHQELQVTEAIFAHRHDGHLLVSAFANDLFAAEDTWTTPAQLLVLDPDRPTRSPGRVVLDGISGSACNGGGNLTSLDEDHVAVACDGNEAVAILNVEGIGTGEPSEAADAIEPLRVCDLPKPMGVRTRSLAAAGAGGFVLATSPSSATNDSAQLWLYDQQCTVIDAVNIGPDAIGTLGQVVTVPGTDTFLVAGTLEGRRGIHVVGRSGNALSTCGTLQGFADHWELEGADPIDPFALAVTEDGSGLAVGAGPFIANPAAVGRGKVLWATLTTSGECGVEADTVVDLTSGEPGYAPAVLNSDPKSWRRAPHVLLLVETP